MSAFASSMITNILANVVFWTIGGAIVWIVLSRQRRRLHRFFGIRKNSPIIVYLSSLIIEPNTLKNRAGIASDYHGLAIVDYEFQVIPALTSLFTSTRLNIPDLFSGLIDSLWLVKRPIVSFRPSPVTMDELQFADLVCVGSPKFNIATDYYLRTGKPYFILKEVDGVWMVEVSRGKRTGEIATATSEWDVGILLKLRDSERGTTIFVAAGGDVNATRAAVEYLARDWSRLLQRYGDEEFGVRLRCPAFDRDPQGYKSLEVTMELPS